jgi:1,4-dihydroxy-2-naphthoate octaprenyltransferase
MKAGLKAHLWTLPRWFAAPLFAGPAALGALLTGDFGLNSWLGVIAVLLVMAGGHSFNTVLDYSWTGLDKGDEESRSAEKDYTGGQSVIARGILTPQEVTINAVGWYLLAFVPIIYLAVNVGWQIVLVGVLGMGVTFWYSKAKFNWTHEIALGSGSGPLTVLAGMYATSSAAPWVTGLIASVPFAILPAFAGLALDEWPDAEANLKKGVKSIAYKVWENGVSLEWYLSCWFLFMYLYQLFLIVTGILVPLTAISFFTWPFVLAGIVMLKQDFRKWAGIAVLAALTYPVLLVVGQAVGG